MKTKEKIIKTAIQLFNEQSSPLVTTNHIAEAAQISSGNLYYHFKNKEEIIRSIFEEIIAYFDDLWTKELSSFDSILDQVLEKNLSAQRHYKFFYLEIAQLLHKDPLLKKRFKKIQAQRLNAMETQIQSLVKSKQIKPDILKSNYQEILEFIWFQANFSLLQLELLYENYNFNHMKEKFLFALDFFIPYLTEESLVSYQTFKKKFKKDFIFSV